MIGRVVEPLAIRLFDEFEARWHPIRQREWRSKDVDENERRAWRVLAALPSSPRVEA